MGIATGEIKEERKNTYIIEKDGRLYEVNKSDIISKRDKIVSFRSPDDPDGND